MIKHLKVKSLIRDKWCGSCTNYDDNKNAGEICWKDVEVPSWSPDIRRLPESRTCEDWEKKDENI